MSDERAIQDALPDNHCWGCGPLNGGGLQIKSHWRGDEAVCTWQPYEEHSAGPPGILNGGIIATIIDCHSICTAIADAYQLEGREVGATPLIWCVTASLEVSYLKPTPISGPVTLRARVSERDGRRRMVHCSLLFGDDGQEYARAKVIAVRVEGSWQRPAGVAPPPT